SSLARARQGAVDLALGILLGGVAALVVELLAARHREVDLDPTVLEVELQRGDREPPAGHGVLQLGYLLALVQQPAGPRWRVVDVARVVGRGDGEPLEEDLAVPHLGVRLGDRAPALSEGLDLTAR